MATSNPFRHGWRYLWIALLLSGFHLSAAQVDAGEPAPLFNDVHFHLSDYVQRGITAREYFDMVGDRVGRVATFGIPLQQKWDYFVSGERAPHYYVTTHKVCHPLWERLDADVRPQVERLNYGWVFDAAVPRVRAWEQRQLSGQ